MVSNGQLANQTTFNNAFVSRTSDTSTVGKMDFLNADVASGATFDNVQRVVNSFASYMGSDTVSAFDVTPTWGYNDVGTSDDNLTERANALTHAFDNSTGHDHSGSTGSGGPILAASLSTVVLRGYMVRGSNLASVTGGTADVSTPMAGKPISTGDTVKGIPITSPNNKVLLRDNTSATQGDLLKDGSGDEIYARITNSGGSSGTWTLTFYTNASGVETAYSGFSSQAVAWYYQQLFNPIVDAPIYNELVTIASDNATQDVIVATTSLKGKVSLSSSTPADVASTGSAGTANASVANADHVHKGVFSFGKSGGTALFAAVTISGGNGITITTTSQDNEIKLSQIATQTFLGRTSGSTGDVETLSATQATAILNVFGADSGSGGVKGLVPATVSGDATKFLKGNGTWAAPTGGGGGGGSLQWVEDANAPTPLVENSQRVYAYQQVLGQALYCAVRVPNSYVAGQPINLRITFYSPDSSGNVLLKTVSTLIRTGTDAITSTTNQRTSTNSAVTLGAGTVNKPQAVVADLSSSSGQINAVSIAAGDLILVQLTRDTGDTATSDAKVPVYGAEVTFS